MRFHHLALEVDCLEEVLPFYTQTLGFTIENQFTFMDEKIIFLTRENFRLEFIQTEESEKNSHLCFEVNDLSEAMKRLDSAFLIEGPYHLKNGWKTVFYRAPNNVIFELLQL